MHVPQHLGSEEEECTALGIVAFDANMETLSLPEQAHLVIAVAVVDDDGRLWWLLCGGGGGRSGCDEFGTTDG